MQLRDYQLGDVIAVKTAFNAGEDYLFYSLATGGGKTVLFMDVTKSAIFKGERVLVMMHREELITQCWQTLYANKIFAGVIKGDQKTDYSRPVQVGSVQTLIRRQNLPPADLIIIDEAHHATRDNSYGKILARYPSARVLLVSATPYRLSGEGFKYIHPYKPTKLIASYQVADLQREGWLVPFRYYVASIPDLTGVKIVRGDYSEEESQKAMELAPLVESYQEHARGKQGVVFTINVAHSIQTVQQYLYAGIPAEHLDANTPTAERQRIISDFRAGLVKVISNVGILTEGADFPSMDFCQCARPTKSLSLFLQMVGRTTRPLAGLVDGLASAEERRAAIRNSSKPCAIVLDNAGLWQDHGLPDEKRDWEKHFLGAKSQKKEPEEEIEMLVFVAEDEQGNRIRTVKAKEVEGMRLIEVTHEVRRKIVNLTSLREFDRQYSIFCNLMKKGKMKRPGYVATAAYIDYCRKNSILLVPEIWEYLEKKLILEIDAKKTSLAALRSRNLEVYPDQLYFSEVKRIEDSGVSRAYLQKLRKDYERDNAGALVRAQLNRMAV